MLTNLEPLEKFLENINQLKLAHELLEQVWLEHCPYGQDPISDKLRYRINDYFEFDDSE